MKYYRGVKVHFRRYYKGIPPSKVLTVDEAVKKGRYTWLKLVSQDGIVLTNVSFKKVRIVK